jgi:hypothetical protein
MAIKRCIQNPLNGEYSLCGDAFDAPDTEDDVEPFRFAEVGEYANCKHCLDLVHFIRHGVTPKGRIRP